MIKFDDILIDCNANKIHIDLTGGWKSALLLYMCAKDINENQPNKASIMPCVVTRINRYNIKSMNRPNAIEIVEQQLSWVKRIFPTIAIDSVLSIPADFWWLPTRKTSITSIDVSERVLLRHTYKMVMDQTAPNQDHEISDVVTNLPIIKSFNAFCKDSSRIVYDTQILEIEQKTYPHEIVLDNNTVSLCKGEIISTQPFRDTTKSKLITIAKELNIFEDLNSVSYTCEQSTKEIVEACGQCYNCDQMKKQ